MTGVLGLDVSTASTGVALPTGRLLTWKPPRLDTPARLAWFATRLDTVLATYSPDHVAFEGYALHSPGIVSTIRLAELGGVLRLVVWRHGIAYTEIPPSELKKWATGRGGASKDEMITAAGARGAEPQNDDEADAALLRFMAIEAQR